MGPGELGVPEHHPSSFLLLSALGCVGVGIPYMNVGGTGAGSKGRLIYWEEFVCVH